MKIKKGEKIWFFVSLFTLIGFIVMIIYQLVNGEFVELPWYEILLNILMLIVMSSTIMKFIEFKK